MKKILLWASNQGSLIQFFTIIFISILIGPLVCVSDKLALKWDTYLDNVFNVEPNV